MSVEKLVAQIDTLPDGKVKLLEAMLRKQGIRLLQLIPLKKAPKKDAYPLSFSQQRLWFLDKFQPDSTVYNIPTAFQLSGELDVSALEKALNAVLSRHHILRTVFREEKGVGVQVVLPEQWHPLPQLDLRSEPQADAVQAAFLEKEADTPFNLVQGPLVRFYLIQRSETDYVLMFNIHHIIFDGWSSGILFGELFTLYDAVKNDQPHPPAPITQYTDYAVWQRRWFRDSLLSDDLKYFRKKLAHLPAVLDLPTDFPRPTEISYEGNAFHFQIDQHLGGLVKSLARTFEATPFMVFLAGWFALLHRYAHQQDICVGSPVANRNRKEVEPLLGFFVNTLVLRGQMADDPDFRTFLAQVKETTLDAYARQDVPFEMLVDTLAPTRSMGHTPLFQVIFTFQNIPETQGDQLGGLTLSPLEIPLKSARVDLTMGLAEGAAGFHGTLEYNTALFTEETMARLAGHFQQILSAAATRPEIRLSRLNLLSEAERKNLLQPLPPPPAYRRQTLHQAFSDAAAKFPERIALTMEETSITYAELEQRTNRLASRLRAYGVGRESRVGLCLERSPAILEAVLAILKAGGAYVPLDPNYPENRFLYILEDSHCLIVLTDSALQDRFPTVTVPVVILDETSDRETHGELPAVSADNAAYVIYTSGSTGKPKGALLPHGNVLRLMTETEHWFQFDENDVWTLFHSYAFDFSVWEMWGPLLYGGRLVVVPYWVSRSPDQFYDLLLQEKVTVLNQTPSAFNQLIQVDRGRPRAEHALRYVIFGGDALNPETLRPWFDRYGGTQPQLVNMYGITETTVHVTYQEIQPESALAGSIIGVPIPDLATYLLSAAFEPMPEGVPGEIYVAGAGLSRGYLARPALTAERFIPNPYTTEPGTRLYKTGDLARYRGTGILEYMGRTDHQVKIRGFRIELGEIEAALTTHPGITEALVLAVKRETTALAAYYIPEKEDPPTVDALRKFLLTSMMDYMVPSFFIELEAYPRTPSGKIDRKALPAPETSLVTAEYEAPSGPMETLTAAFFAQVLERENVGAGDNFFALGGDSIISIRLVALFKEAGYQLAVKDIFANQTVRELAEILDSRRGVEVVRPAYQPFSLITEEDRERLPKGIVDAYPMTRLQTGMIYHGLHEPGAQAYHNITSMRINAVYNPEAFRRTLAELCDWYPTLRTSMDVGSFSRPMQLVHGQVSVPLTTVDLSHLDDSIREAALARWLDEETRRTFDWRQAPLIRFTLHHHGGDSFQCTFTEHHTVLDGWSVATLLNHLLGRYFGRIQNVALPKPPELETGYHDFVALEQHILETPETTTFWGEYLSGAELSPVPRPPQKPVASEQSGKRALNVPVDTFRALRQLGTQANVSLKTVFLAAHLRLTALLAHQDTVLTGLVANCRPETHDADRVLGLFLNTIPFRQTLSGGSWLDLVKAVFDNEQQVNQHRRYPLPEILKAANSNQLFEIAFNFTHFHVLGTADSEVTKPEETPAPAPIETEFVFAPTSFPLIVSVDVNLKTETCTLQLLFDANLFSDAWIDRIGAMFQGILGQMAANPNNQYQRAELTPPSERERLRTWSARKQSPYPRETMDRLFEKTAARYGERPALRQEGRVVSYRALNAAANRIAHRLRAVGVTQDTVVGVMMPRSPRLIAGLLGILKAGAAYLPLDPAYPDTRLQHMMSETRTNLLLTEKGVDTTRLGAEITAVWIEDIETAELPEHNLGVDNHIDRLAYINFTSGSTGLPKGPMIPHRAVVRLLFNADYVRLNEETVMMHMAPAAFDASTIEIWGPLLHGGCCVLFPNEPAEPTLLGRTIRENGVNTLWLTAALFNVVVDQAPDTLSDLDQLLVGGEALSVSHIRKAWNHLPKTRLINGYGPTENTTFTCCYPMTSPVEEGRRTVPIGRPISGTHVNVLNGHLQPVPIGVPGELFIGGDGLARGYANRPGQTADLFRPDPFGDGTRLYRSGDLVRYQEDGMIDFIGRRDFQVKIRGFRIETGEIEAILAQHTAVGEVVVRVITRASGDKELAAYLVGLEEVATAEIASWFADRAPAYMMPHHFMWLDAVPLTHNGKVDVRALPMPQRAESTVYLAPRTPAEEVMAEIWCALLEVDRVSVDDHFFEIGGDSIKATRLVSRFNEAFQVEVSIRELFENPSLESMSLLAERKAKTALPPIQAAPAGTAPTLSFSQERLWFLDQLEPANPSYNIPLCLRLRGTVHVNAVQQSFATIIDRHEVLRCSFHAKQGAPEIRLHPTSTFQVEMLDLSAEVDPISAAKKLTRVTFALGFDLAADCLIRVRLLKLDETDSVLLVNMSHIVSDGWSMGVMLREFMTLYQGFVQNQTVSLEPLDIQYNDYAAWMRNWFVGEVAENERNYWKSYLENVPQMLNLPLDFERPPVQTTRGALKMFTLPPKLTTALRELSSNHDATLFMTLLAAFETLLYRFSGQAEFCVGTPIANRNRAQLEPLIGFFVNTLCLRADLSEDPHFSTLLDKVRLTTLDAYHHPNLPFEQLLDTLNVTRNLSAPPLFQVMFVLQNTPAQALKLDKLTLESWDPELSTTKFDLTLTFTETGEHLFGALEYNTDLFAETTIARMTLQLERLLDGITANPKRPISTYSLLDPSEKRRISLLSHGKKADWTLETTIPQLFRRRAAVQPDHPALVFGEQELSYGVLDQKANQLAHHLRALGVGPNVLVPVCLLRSIELVIALYAVHKAGGAYVPLDPTTPKSRSRDMLNQTGAPMILTHSHLVEQLPGSRLQAVALDRLDLDHLSTKDPGVSPAPDLPAYVIFTSGTTGQPKGVVVPHRSVCNRLHASPFPLGPDDRVLQKTPYTFDVSVFELFAPLIHGATLVIAEPEKHTDPHYIAQILNQQRITYVHFVPSMLTAFLELSDPGPCKDLRHVACSGEALALSQIKRFYQRFPVTLYNLYGPTEAAVEVSTQICSAEMNKVTIGRPIPNVSLHILDIHGQPLPIGFPGELHIGGVAPAQGYLHEPVLTASKFVPNLFAEIPGQRLYRTGDLVRWLENGEIDFLGRIDHQVKIRGLRIELGDINSAVGKFANVSDTTTLAHQAATGEQYLVAYLAMAEPFPEPKQLRAFLADHLPAYMIPDFFIFMTEFPLSASGKINRRKLPKPGPAMAENAQFVPPESDIEIRIAAIWCDLLGLETIGIHHNFFDLGGHSLLATRAAARIREAFQVEFTVRDLFEAPTIAGIAAKLTGGLLAPAVLMEPVPRTGMDLTQFVAALSQKPDDDVTRELDRLEAPPLPDDLDADLLLLFPGLSTARQRLLLHCLRQTPAEIDHFPLSHAQQRLWFLQNLDPTTIAYNMPGGFRLNGPLNMKALNLTFDRIVDRHEILRARFIKIDGKPRQVVLKDRKPCLELVDLAAEDDPVRAAQARCAHELQRPFNLINDAPLRLYLLRLAEDDHVLFLNMHHIVSDGWSIGIVLKELVEGYTAFAKGIAPDHTPLPVQFTDFAAWSRRFVEGQGHELQSAYWKKRLADPASPLEIPGRKASTLQTFNGAMIAVTLPKPNLDALDVLAREKGATRFMCLLSAFQVLVFRYTGRIDFNLGTPVSGRTRPEIEPLIGMFVNTLVLRANLDPCLQFSQLLSLVRDNTMKDLANQDIPFEHLIDIQQPDRDLGHTPLFQIMFVLQNTPMGELSLPNLTLSPWDLKLTSAKFELTISHAETPDGLILTAEYNTDLFSNQTIEQLLNCYKVLLTHAAEAPQTPITQLPIMESEERARILNHWNVQPHFSNPAQPLHHLFEQRVAQSPEATALVFEETRLSYCAVNERANGLARLCMERGVLPGQLVGLCLERGHDLIAGILAILKAGAAYVPLDPHYPADRLAYMIADCKPAMVLTTGEHGEDLPACNTLLLDTLENPAHTDNPIVGSAPHDPAYLIYTSGTTGNPKAAMIGHHQVVRLFEATRPDFQFAPTDVWTMFHSYAFDFSVWEIWGALLHGGTLVVTPYWVSRSPDDFYHLLVAEKVTILNQTPSAFKQLLQVDADRKSPDLALRAVVFGGEALDLPSLKPWFDRHPKQPRLINMYGITETTVHVTYYEVDPEHLNQNANIGRPIRSLQLYLVDPRMEPVPHGIPGEILVGGEGLALGYLNRAALTAEKFVPHPFSTQPGARLYRSGDAGYYHQDGNVIYRGRIDQQVKIRGFRIEPGEIESVLKQQPHVQDATVVVHGSADNSKILVGYLALGSQPETSVAEVRRGAAQRLPDYMLPTILVPLDQLPLTNTGKVNKRALPKPEQNRISEEGFCELGTPTEELLAEIWRDLLELEATTALGATHNFFHLGGHSMLGTQLTSRVRKAFGIDLPLRDVFEYPVLRDLAHHIELLRREGGAQHAAIEAAPRTQRLPLSFAQARLWFLDQLEPNNAFYNVPWLVELQGELEVDLLHRAVETVIARHEILRTVFPKIDGEAVQRILPPPRQPMQVVHPSASVTETDAYESARRLALEEVAAPFHLAEGPLFRVKLIPFATHRYMFCFTMHHIICDAWSIGVLTTEISTLYRTFAAMGENPFPPLEIQYADYAVWQRNIFAGQEAERQMAYWRQQLAHVEPLELPLDKPRPAMQTFNGHLHALNLEPAVVSQLNTLASGENVTLFMLGLAAFQSLLYRYTGQTDLTVGTPASGRNRGETEPLIGFFLNTLVLRADLSDDPSFRELLARTRDIVLTAFSHQDLPFEKLVEELQPQRSMSRSPLFQVLFTFRSAGSESLSLDKVQLLPVETEGGSAKFDLSLFLTQHEQGMVAAVEYNTDLFHEETMAKFLQHFQIFLEALVADPDQPVSTYRILTDPEAQRLKAWNHTEQAWNAEKGVHQLFVQHTDALADKIALIGLSERLTYQELNHRANRLAHYLRRLGVGPDVAVGLHLHRDSWMPISMLAVLKAGGVYLPLDPQYPPERIRQIVADARPGIMLIQEDLQLDTGDLDIQFICPDKLDLTDYPSHNPDIPVTGDNLAYLIYTSGSTGKPKGVAMPHRPLYNLILWKLSQHKLRPSSRTLQQSSFSFDVHYMECFSTWASGGSLVMVSEETKRDPAALWHFLKEAEIEHMIAPFILIQQLAEISRVNREIPAALHHVAGTAEQMQANPTVKQLFEKLAQTRICNEYGPSESHVVTAFDLPQDPTTWQPFPSIGKPIANTTIYILDKNLNPTPVGIPGELYIGGICLARGYLNRPDQTAERFIPDHLFPDAGSRMYRSGDLARYLPDGNIVCLGRIDNQVKIRGFRIELGEIEAVLGKHPSLDSVVVDARDFQGEKRMVAFVRASEPCDSAVLKAYVAEMLPDYMVPAYFVFVDEMPLTPSGKIARKQLPTPDGDLSTATSEFVAPRNQPEELVSQIWCDILGAAPIGVCDNFFERGGHSLLATRVVSRLSMIFRVEYPVRYLFEHPTIEGTTLMLARLLNGEAVLHEMTRLFLAVARGLSDEQALELTTSNDLLVAFEDRLGEPDEQASLSLSQAKNDLLDRLYKAKGIDILAGGIGAKPADKPTPASFSQERLWFLNMFDQGSPAYNLPFAFKVIGSLNEDALRRALAEIMNRHEVLRSVYQEENQQLFLQTLPDAEPEMTFLDLTTHPVPTREEEARRLITQTAAQRFDLAQGPLFRAVLAKLDVQDYRFLICFHHIVFDGWSIGVFLGELDICYRAFSSGVQPTLPPLPIQFGDFAYWQRNWLSGDRLQKQMDYWRNVLRDAPAPLDFPTDFPRPKQQSFAGARNHFRVPAECSHGIATWCRRHGTTPFAFLLTGFKALTALYSGQRDICVGTPVAGRNRIETESLIGFFVNSLVLRSDLDGNPTMGELIPRVRETVLGAFAHQDLPFEHLVAELQPSRDLARTPLFQVLFILQNTSLPDTGSAESKAGPRFEGWQIDNPVSKFDLTLSMTQDKDGFEGSFEYNTDLFTANTIERLSSHFNLVLLGLLEQSETPLAAFSLLSREERELVLHQWNQTHTEADSKISMTSQFAVHVAQSGSAPALIHGTGSLSYAELNAYADRVAQALLTHGLKPGERVGIRLRRSPAMIASMLGVLKAGGVYVPLDPAYPADRVAFMLKDSRAAILLTTPDVTHQDETNQNTCLNPETLPSAGVPVSIELPAEAPAYIIYTSGSTGRPKGVIISHRAAMAMVWWALDLFPRESLAHMTASTSICFDLSIYEIFVPLSGGTTIVLVDNILALTELKVPVTLINTVPSALTELLHLGDLPPSVKIINLAGEPLKERLVTKAYQQPNVEKVYNLFGPSEDTTYSTWELCTSGQTPTIGKPIHNTQAYVLNPQMVPQPIGVAGELYLAGDGLTLGYHDRPELTAERYLPNPFATEAGSRMYKTGDMTSWLPDGRLKLIGRIDHQIKLRGYRIELGEIEAVIDRFPSVSQCVVLIRETAAGDQRLVAYLVAAEGVTIDTEALKIQLKVDLPEFMIPGIFMMLDALPLLPNGKVNRAALPTIEGVSMAKTAQYVPPTTPTQEALVLIWEEVLGIKDIGIHHNFFELGGHSLLATRVISSIRQVLGLELSLKSLFEAPTIAELAALLEQGGSQEVALPPMEATPRRGDLPATFSQKRIWKHEQTHNVAALYNVPGAIRIQGDLDRALMGKSIQLLVQRHEPLRTALLPNGQGDLCQVIMEAPDTILHLHDLSDLPTECRKVEAEKRAILLAAEPFDTARAPLIRAHLLILDVDNHILLLNMHHSMIDLWSVNLIWGEIWYVYQNLTAGTSPTLPELEFQYADFAIWQEEFLKSAFLDDQFTYWEDILGQDIPDLQLPFDRAHGTMASYNGSRETQFLTDSLSQQVVDAARRRGATLFNFTLTAFTLLLQRISGQDHFAVGTPISGRNRKELEPIVGCFLNSLTLPMDLRQKPDFTTLLNQIRETALQAFLHQDLPFEVITDRLVKADRGRTPFYQVYFVMQQTAGGVNGADTGSALPNLRLTPIDMGVMGAKYELVLVIMEAGGRLTCSFDYNTDLFDAATIQDLMSHLVRVLEEVST